jgi:predicted lipoprotein with Yx(FWY)xxD motif
MRHLGLIGVVAAAASCISAHAALAQSKKDIGLNERYVQEPVPAGVKVFPSKLDGPIYVDAGGRTFYQWPRKELRNGGTGDMKGAASICDNTKSTENIGLMSPYPPGLTLPDVATRKSCEEMWPPAIAAAGSQPVGKWSIIKRKDGRDQWAYDGFVLYHSVMDKKPGDTIGGNSLNRKSGDPPASPGGDAPVYRVPIGPMPDVPGQFVVEENLVGRQLTLVNGATVYTWDGDRPGKSNCDVSCLKSWQPVLAPEIGAKTREDWSVVERSPGVKQWAYRGRPLYTYVADPGPGMLHGTDTPGWTAVYTQLAPPPPSEFTKQDSPGGIVLADSKGKTIYIYNCGDDAVDQLLCDHPDTPQTYRYAVCGGGSPAKCLANFPYVIATNGAKGANEAWTVKAIDPATGNSAKPGQADALQVWAYRDRPVFTFVRDDRPGSIRAQNWGEFYGQRNGYKAFFLREEFQGR